MDMNIKLFIKEFTKEIEEDNAAIFAGAGLSVPAGYVDWKQLLEPIAEELRVDIEKENDLVALAQYHCNENLGNRNKINQIIINEFSQSVNLTENHKILAKLPIKTYWTTNYDKLIEKALEKERKNPDVKYTVEQLAVTKPKRHATVYKMHGDKNHPHDAVIIKDDYESYYLRREPFITALSGDLVSKTFLFIGFSFSDPNIDYILSRIRSKYSKDQRRHYYFMKKIARKSEETESEFKYRKRKQELFIKDLKRFNIQTLLVDEYTKITSILKTIEKNIQRKTIFLSGSASTYGTWDDDEAKSFIHNLSKEFIKKDYNIVSGFGLGVGSLVISGSLEEMFINQHQIENDKLILRPFPQETKGKMKKEDIWQKYREDMISRTGMSIFIFGNKVVEGEIVNANGVKKEFEIALAKNSYVIPVGATGYTSKELWEEINNNFDKYYPNADGKMKSLFEDLNSNKTSEELIKTIIEFTEKLKRWY